MSQEQQVYAQTESTSIHHAMELAASSFPARFITDWVTTVTEGNFAQRASAKLLEAFIVNFFIEAVSLHDLRSIVIASFCQGVSNMIIHKDAKIIHLQKELSKWEEYDNLMRDYLQSQNEEKKDNTQ